MGISTLNPSYACLQGKLQLNAGLYTEAFKDYSVAARRFLTGKDYVNGQRALNIAIDECLPKINKEGYEEGVEDAFNTLLTFMESKHVNNNGRFYDRIEALKRESKKAKLREPAKKSQ